MRHRISALLLALAFAAAACAGDDDATSDDTASDDDDDDVEDGDDSDDAPLTASARGVTETEILVGIGFVDASDFGFNSGDLEAQWRTAIDAVNEAGGINGRMLAPVFDSLSPVGSVEAEEVCIRFTEDEEVFAFIGFVREDNELCYTEQHDTLAVNTDTATTESVDRSKGLLFTADSTKIGLELLAVDAAAAEGLVDGHRVHINANAVDEPLVAPVREALEAAGAEITGSAVQTSPTGDVPAVESELDLVIQRALADGADTIFAISDIGLSTSGAVQRSGTDLTVITTHANDDTYLNFSTDPAAIDLRVFAPEPLESLFNRGAAGVDACVSRYEEASGNTVNVGVDDPDPNNFPATVRACRGVDVFVAIATAAGPDLTNEAFVAAADALGSFELTGAAAASMAPDKVGADDSPLVSLEWDAATLTFQPAG